MTMNDKIEIYKIRQVIHKKNIFKSDQLHVYIALYIISYHLHHLFLWHIICHAHVLLCIGD